MNLQQLKVFVLTVQLKKLYLVAQQLEITQPTVTFHLNKLQEELGIALFHTKSYHVIKLTEAGQAFYHYASQIHSLSSEAEATMDVYRGTAAGVLAVGSTHTPATYLLPPLLKQLKASNPRLTVMLDVRPAPFILDKLKRYELDIGIISNTRVDDPELVSKPLLKDDLVLIFPPDHALASAGELQPGDLAEHPFVSHEPGSISRQLIDRWADSNEVKFQISLEVSGTEALKAAVKHGLGYGMIAEAAVQEEQLEGKLCTRAIPKWVPERQIYAVRHRNKLITPALQEFWKSLAEAFSEQRK
ncbi:LysR family transcriptional regulator [Paenibacillus sp. 7541]|uniref:LysR family transcriptional regulator n=1 Tax=Paenibacillus sp. 7541 TaxID=2026236 RepID=UPI000BA681A1|nr:LysR family transcriptional regulator [Paenibacillus sp. 7541]PAK54305.1 LysR family transcriptional regulator [Paenibacillus sp. 7541]